MTQLGGAKLLEEVTQAASTSLRLPMRPLEKGQDPVLQIVGALRHAGNAKRFVFHML